MTDSDWPGDTRPLHIRALERRDELLAAPAKPKSRRGFASMDRALVAELAQRGGRAAHAAGTANKFTSATGREAGRKGGAASGAKRHAASSGS